MLKSDCINFIHVLSSNDYVKIENLPEVLVLNHSSFLVSSYYFSFYLYTISRMLLKEWIALIHCIVIYLLASTVHPLNSRGQILSEITLTCVTRNVHDFHVCYIILSVFMPN